MPAGKLHRISGYAPHCKKTGGYPFEKGLGKAKALPKLT
ncbi:hypothetical protein AYK18_09900 [Acetobacter orientalis]|uniref:Uncharacterized protein n=1 Tax=Acetobacter orientalis TaxID=146474 RepID=A0A2Z5ZF84_9PROT|nr:hypothetical protein AYK18_09900 [Acetobacter orientalis]